MNKEQGSAINPCENCGSYDMEITVYDDQRSSQTVFHCSVCGYIHWKDSLTQQ